MINEVIVGIILTILYLTVGYVVSAVIDTLENEDVEEKFSCWLLWPFLLVGYLVIKIVLWIGRRVSVWPLVITELLKLSIERDAERRRKREVRRLLNEVSNAKTKHDRESGKDR